MKDDYPAWVCSHCGAKYGTRIPMMATCHMGRGGVCNAMTVVTQPRDYGHLQPGWWDEPQVEDDPYDVVVSANLNI
jgi:hypothetical protein